LKEFIKFSISKNRKKEKKKKTSPTSFLKINSFLRIKKNLPFLNKKKDLKKELHPHIHVKV
jgi:hypothetical protein